jgi:hypothetical protein
MPLFWIIEPSDKVIREFRADDYKQAMAEAGLKQGQIDFGTLTTNLSIIVYDYGLLEGKENFFSIAKQLYQGNAVIYNCNDEGETIDVNRLMLPNLLQFWDWYKTVDDVEKGIAEDRVRRPSAAVNGKVVWEWNKDKS